MKSLYWFFLLFAIFANSFGGSRLLAQEAALHFGAPAGPYGEAHQAAFVRLKEAASTPSPAPGEPAEPAAAGSPEAAAPSAEALSAPASAPASAPGPASSQAVDYSIRLVPYSGGLTFFRTWQAFPPGPEAEGRVDIAVLSAGPAARGCQEGLFEPLVDPLIGPLQRQAYTPLPSEAGGACALPWVLWETRIFGLALESTVPFQAFFDPETYPGARAVLARPEYVLELALLAAGVEGDAVYTTLENEAALEKLLAGLAGLSFLWLHHEGEVLDAVLTKRARFGIAPSYVLHEAVYRRNKPFGLARGGSLVHSDWLVAPKSGGVSEGAARLAVLYRDEVFVELHRHLGVLPASEPFMRRLHQGGHTPMTPEALSQFLETQFVFDALWWEEHRSRITSVFEKWRQPDDS